MRAQLVRAEAVGIEAEAEREVLHTSLVSAGRALDARGREVEDVRRCTAVTEEMLADTIVGMGSGSEVYNLGFKGIGSGLRV
jgi:hypothetical protein